MYTMANKETEFQELVELAKTVGLYDSYPDLPSRRIGSWADTHKSTCTLGTQTYNTHPGRDVHEAAEQSRLHQNTRTRVDDIFSMTRDSLDLADTGRCMVTRDISATNNTLQGMEKYGGQKPSSILPIKDTRLPRILSSEITSTPTDSYLTTHITQRPTQHRQMHVESGAYEASVSVIPQSPVVKVTGTAAKTTTIHRRFNSTSIWY